MRAEQYTKESGYYRLGDCSHIYIYTLSNPSYASIDEVLSVAINTNVGAYLKDSAFD